MTTLPPPAPSEQPSGTATTFPPPTGAQVLRALRAPAVGYAWLFAGAVLTMALIVLAANVGSTGDETGVESEDTNGIGVLIGMPFQIASMALLGSLHFSSDGVGVSLFLPPLVLTALYLVGTARAAARVEIVPVTGTRALLATAVGLVMAMVVTPLTWALAMRHDGVALHASSVGLFFGAWALTGLAFYVGASRAAGASRPPWVPSDYAAAFGLWARSVLVWIAVALPVLVVVAGVQEAFWVSLVVPVWGATVALYTYAFGHLGAVTLAGEDLTAWGFDAAWTIVMILGAVVLAVLTSIAWHLRRDTRAGSLATPGSWVVLPVVYAAGGMVLWLLPTVVLGGGIGGATGSLTLQPAFWFVFVLVVWGAAVELAGRFVAPSLAQALPPRLVAVLRGRGPTAPTRDSGDEVEGASPHAVVHEPRPLTPEERARYKLIGIAVAGALVLLLAGLVTASVLNNRFYGPEDQARAYLDAVVEADLAKALDLAPVGDEADDELLTSTIYRAAENRITGYELGDIEEEGAGVSVEVRLEGLGEDVEAELLMEKDGHTAGVFDRWRVIDGGLVRSVTLTVPESSDGLTINGAEVGQVDDYVWLLPGDYTIDAYAGSPWLESAEDPVTVSAEEEFQFLDVPEATASEAFVAEVQRQVDAYLAGCIAAEELDPDGCPNSAYGGSEVRNVQWTLESAPVPDFSSFRGTFPADLSYGESGRATVTYELDESYGFGRPDWQPQTEESDLYLGSVTVTEQNGELVVDIED